MNKKKIKMVFLAIIAAVVIHQTYFHVFHAGAYFYTPNFRMENFSDQELMPYLKIHLKEGMEEQDVDRFLVEIGGADKKDVTKSTVREDLLDKNGSFVDRKNVREVLYSVKRRIFFISRVTPAPISTQTMATAIFRGNELIQFSTRRSGVGLKGGPVFISQSHDEIMKRKVINKTYQQGE